MGVALLEQLEGTAENLGSPMIWIGTELACSLASFTSAALTGPQVTPSENWAHSAIGVPRAVVCWGKERLTALDNSLSPYEPVSTSTPEIVWQLEVPGTQIVTGVKTPFA